MIYLAFGPSSGGLGSSLPGPPTFSCVVLYPSEDIVQLDKRIVDFWSGGVPDGFCREHEAKTRFFHRMNVSGPLSYLSLLELLWDWRDYFPPSFKRLIYNELEFEPVPEPELESEPEPVPPPSQEEPVVEEVDWDTVEEGRDVAAFYDGKFFRGQFVGHSGDRAKIALRGDEKAYRIISREDVDLNG